jgi:coenzyme F420 hydrogenase subunit beta
MTDVFDEGLRPTANGSDCTTDCQACLDVCPGDGVDYTALQRIGGFPDDDPFDLLQNWGPATGLWEGCASDEEIRYMGSSGGALTALSLYCLEKECMHGVLHIAQKPGDSIRNQTQLSRSREQLLRATGSRYAPASVCDGLGLVESAPTPCVVIGKPSEIAATRKAAAVKPALADKIGVTLSFFCAETPSTSGTVKLLREQGVDPDNLASLRYRGHGWPGHFAPTKKGKQEPEFKMTYRESWAQIQASRPWAAQIWPDGSGELADISCGDPWYEEPDGKNPGFSLVVARTEIGRRIVEGAIEAGYLRMTKAEPWKVSASQRGLLQKKASIWGRLLAMRLAGIPAPRYPGLNLLPLWQKLPFKQKFKSVVGTLTRIIQRKLYRCRSLN